MNILKGLKRNQLPENQPDPQEVAPEEMTVEKPASGLKKVGDILATIGRVIWRLRKILMSIPVLYGAFRLAFYNMANLPEQVGLNLQVNGEFAQMIDRNLAVYGPLGVTAACLLIMFLSRKALHPWIISIFSLVLPLLILFTNLYPQ